MIIKTLVVHDFRAYCGTHEIDLMPRSNGTENRPVVIFGGLNGAGKTTILLAIRLALYGRLAIDSATTKKAYHEFIRESIHDTPATILRKNSAFVEITFLHGKIGEESEYVVRRSWYDTGTEIKEHLDLSQNKIRDLSLTSDAIQGLLNDLIPIGVADLFFFDGERISELAEDSSGRALQTAFDRLYGLDLVERLRNDLRVYLIKQQQKKVDQSDNNEIDEKKAQYQFYLKRISTLKNELTFVREKQAKLQSESNLLEAKMLARGGEWGVSREEQKKKAQLLSETLQSKEKQLREILGGVYPLNLAHELIAEIFEQLSKSLHTLSVKQSNDLLEGFSSELGQFLDPSGKRALETLLEKWQRPAPCTTFAEDISIASISRLERIVNHGLSESRTQSADVLDEIRNTSEDLDEVSRQIERAPDEAVLAGEFRELERMDASFKDLEAEIEVRLNELKQTYIRSIDIARILRKKYQKISEQIESEKPVEYAIVAREALVEFRRSRAKNKLAELEKVFTDTFNRLVRKSDYIHESRIDPDTYSIVLVSSDGREMKKSVLSAGEKQIFAIAMLEALAKTSEHKLPVVVDTPLARLDSNHRANLVSDYFTHASHQVILLSTDTEIDERFFNQLLPLTSHCFEISYDAEKRSSEISEGYFWERKNGGTVNDSAQN